ncbi:hypothetical protein [Saprospira grandis]|uniref:hypothetical protein n=1 Tax=Saprospira grandis TaxID=1008 RepID=UPI0022DE5877|nr:hypothetical protein [Saprospira grandis]WBM76214.1 hypothetical protein OP864_08260 [Saprospira grandis]
MKNEIKVEAWEPLPNLPEELYVQRVIDNSSDLEIILTTGDDKKGEPFLRVKFDFFLGYRSFNESYRIGSFPALTTSFSLITISGSDFVDWIMEESLGVYFKKEEVVHYMMGLEDMFEVLATEPPEVEWVTDREWR